MARVSEKVKIAISDAENSAVKTRVTQAKAELLCHSVHDDNQVNQHVIFCMEPIEELNEVKERLLCSGPAPTF